MAPRSSDWVLIAYFVYAGALAPFFPVRPELRAVAAVLAVGAPLLLFGLARWNHPAAQISRDWVPLGLTLLAYREMDWFTPPYQDHHLEHAWILWDRLVLDHWGVRAAIESIGWGGPVYLESCYLLVYAVGPLAVALLYIARRRNLVNTVLFCYLLGTLACYGLFPFFPSEPPRIVFRGEDLPGIFTPVRRVNLAIVTRYGIHSSVFPSAHVASVFSAGWGLWMGWKERRLYGAGMLLYGVSVAIASVYGRYHYAADAVAGIGVSLLAVPLAARAKRAHGDLDAQGV